MPRIQTALTILVTFAAFGAWHTAFGQPPDEPVGHDWRRARHPRIDLPPDPALIQIVPDGESGFVNVLGRRHAAADKRANMVRIVNLATADEVAAPVAPDGAFAARLFAPAGSALQINSLILDADALPVELREAMRKNGRITPADMPHRELYIGLVGSHVTSSPAIVIPIVQSRVTPNRWPAFVRKVGPHCWLLGSATSSKARVDAGETLDVDVQLTVVQETAALDDLAVTRPEMAFALHRLFDGDGRQRSFARQPTSDVLTPTGLPIETHGEMMAEPRPDGRRVWNLGGNGIPLPHQPDGAGEWREPGPGRASLSRRWHLEIPSTVPPGRYGIAAMIWGVGDPEYDAGEPVGGPWCFGYVTVGRPAPPRLTCLLLGSTGTAGTRGTVAREDRGRFAINTKIAFTPDKLVIPRDDAYTGRPIAYPLDPYLPMLGMMHRPPPVIPRPLIPLNCRTSRLRVTVETPDGRRQTLGPARLSALQNDLSVLRPDYVYRDRVMAPVAPTYGNPSASDILHLSGRGAFDYAFDLFGHYQIELAGQIDDFAGTSYEISGTYDVYVAQPLDVEIFPEPGTPLQPNTDIVPQVRVLPALPADVEMRWRHYPHSDNTRVVERTIQGRANRWGVFVPSASEPPICFTEPGEYSCDVTVSCTDQDGKLWMACQRGASVVATPNSSVIVHGERGNRSPTARWRARWFMAGDGRFIAPPAHLPEEPEREIPPWELINRVDMGHTCLPYEPGDVAWLGHRMNFSLFPGITFEDTEGTIADLIEQRWPAVREGAGREGLYPYELKPEDRRAIGELPYVCMTASGLPPSVDLEKIDQWGYFYAVSWRPGVAVRALVAEDAQPVGYWFFDDPYGYQFGNGPQGDLPGDVKMNYGGGVFRDETSGVTHYGGYASMLVLIDGSDPLGARVLPPFDGLLPGSPRCGPLLQMGGQRYDVFLTFGAVAPGAVLDVGDQISLGGAIWPPVEGSVAVEIVSPSGERYRHLVSSDPLGTFSLAGLVADEPGVWEITAEAVCTGKTSAGTIREEISPERWPRGGGIGLPDKSFALPVTRPGTGNIVFDIPPGSRAHPPLPLLIRGALPPGNGSRHVDFLVSLPGQVVARGTLDVDGGQFEYRYHPETLRRQFPNIDTRIEMPAGGYENRPAWFDTVTFTFWAGQGRMLSAGTVVLQGEQLYALTPDHSARQLPSVDVPLAERDVPAPLAMMPMPAQSVDVASEKGDRRTGEPFGGETLDRASAAVPKTREMAEGHKCYNSLLTLSSDGEVLFAAHPWSGEVVRMRVGDLHPEIQSRCPTGGQPSCVALGPDETALYVALSDRDEVVVLSADTLRELHRFPVGPQPRAAVPSADGNAVYVADFSGDRIERFSASTGQREAVSEHIDRPACLAVSPDRDEVYTVSFRTGELVVFDTWLQTLRRLKETSQLNQCRTLTLSSEGLLFAPQTRSDTVNGGRMFDRSVFPAIVVARPDGRISISYSPDLLVVPPHRAAEAVVDQRRLFLASSGSDDVLAIDRQSGFAQWHNRSIGQEPGAIALDGRRERLYVLTITGQEIITLGALTGVELSRVRFTEDSTPPQIARGRYLFGTATDKRLTKDQWMSCAVCHPDGEQDGRVWDLGDGPLDTRSLRGSLLARPLHFDGHLDEIQDTFEFTRSVMAGQWFVPRDVVHSELDAPNGGRDDDLDALAAYIGSLAPRQSPPPPAELVADVRQGRAIFFSDETKCSRCHPPPYYTDSGHTAVDGSFVLHNVGTRSGVEAGGAPRLDTPSLLGLDRSEPYLHDGRAATIDEIFSKWNPEDKHGKTSHLSGDQLRQLVLFLRQL